MISSAKFAEIHHRCVCIPVHFANEKNPKLAIPVGPLLSNDLYGSAAFNPHIYM